jgi:hypothetical protein
VLFGPSDARAFPPAPAGYIYGMVKDQFGNPLQNPADMVVLRTSSGAIVTANIQPNLAIGVNYILEIPMDAGATPTPYVANALTAGTPYTLYVTVNSVTNVPIEMNGVTLVAGQPSQRTLQNLTVGADANNDGIPDAWEQAFLQSIGVNLTLNAINPNSVYAGDNRTLKQEYLLGNYPYSTNAFKVTIVSQNAGSAVLSFTTTLGRTYTAYGSSDLQNWTPLSFSIPAAGNATMTSYYSSGIQPLEIQTVQPAKIPPMQFFRLQLQ